ncbi:helix-turn-helix transcriptional regulator [Miniphocaeibacter massiliensis]|uniref:helix-turn-helix transcriptional regulator n=1 Tax=Miniphocaeibacter massiliensis TaxID=2041841 RepID=UPI000C1C1EE2|nr:helix-turn-helix transcriptional regulator [Miniphocaeibacter massiliensis]
MKSVMDDIENLKRLVKMIASQFGSNTEVILHDHVYHDYDNSVVAIENGYITGRKVGDGGTNLGLEAIRKNTNENTGDSYCYFTKTKDGKVLRSSTYFFRNENNEVIGSLCLNTDISDYMNLGKSIENITMYTPEKEIEEIFANSVGDLIDHFINEAKLLLNKPVDDMSKEDKIKILTFLDKKGFFLISKSGDIACDYLKMSKYTLYKYLNEIRETDEDKSYSR